MPEAFCTRTLDRNHTHTRNKTAAAGLLEPFPCLSCSKVRLGKLGVYTLCGVRKVGKSKPMWTRMHGSWNHLGRAWQHHLALHLRVFFLGHSSPSQMLELLAPTAALRGLAGTAALRGDDSSRAMEAAEQAWGFPNFKISSCEDGTDTTSFTFLVGSFGLRTVHANCLQKIPNSHWNHLLLQGFANSFESRVQFLASLEGFVLQASFFHYFINCIGKFGSLPLWNFECFQGCFLQRRGSQPRSHFK